MNVVILGVLSAKFAATVAGFLLGFSVLLLAMLVLRRRVQGQMRPILVGQTNRPSAPTWFPGGPNTRSVDMASRAPPPRVPKRHWMSSDVPSRRRGAGVRS
jgi:hypothetical protein